jgi:hypothetical protein
MLSHKVTQCSRLLEKLMVAQLIKKSIASYRTRKLTAVFTRVRHWTLLQARWIQTSVCDTNEIWSVTVWNCQFELGQIVKSISICIFFNFIPSPRISNNDDISLLHLFLSKGSHSRTSIFGSRTSVFQERMYNPLKRNSLRSAYACLGKSGFVFSNVRSMQATACLFLRLHSNLPRTSCHFAICPYFGMCP